MTAKQILSELKALGTAQNRKIYKRHGADTDDLYGVSYGNLNTYIKKIKKDQALAEELWETGNFDARNLAFRIADPDAFTSTMAMAWAREVGSYFHASELGRLLGNSSHPKELVKKLTASKKEYIAQAGYSALGSMLKHNPEALTDEEAWEYVTLIEDEIHDRPNWTRYGMNWALIAIGGYKPGITNQVIQAAKRIGVVDVDHGETSCKTPDAAAYIEKMAKRRK